MGAFEEQQRASVRHQRLLVWLNVSALLYGIGMVWQHLNGQVPYWGIAWDGDLWKGWAGLTGMEWPLWLERVAPVTVNILTALGLALAISGTLVLILPVRKNWQKRLGGPLVSAWSLYLGLLTLWQWKDHAYAWPYLVEHSIRVALPWILYRMRFSGGSDRLTLNVALGATALTFLGHGWYALGLAPRPGDFMYMTCHSLNCSETFAVRFLVVAGILDMAVVAGIWWRPIRKPLLGYAVGWGLLTAVARITGHFHAEFWQESLLVWIPEMLVRSGHGLVPLILLLVLRPPNVPGFQAANSA